MDKKTGKIIQIIGPVVDVQFEHEHMPELYNALTVAREGKSALVLEVVKHLEPGRVRTISLDSTDGMQRGTDVNDTGSPIEVPVGSEVLGHIFNVLGEPLD